MICTPCTLGYHDDCTWGTCACACWRETESPGTYDVQGEREGNPTPFLSKKAQTYPISKDGKIGLWRKKKFFARGAGSNSSSSENTINLGVISRDG